ncbi:acetoin utilization protein AcuC [uncultured Corynebacterium sp.]|uniref:acetoin utilization protein AcuC n=1 Tax=uncultured Corynebacterium sp. TaxID=159447 RepID=UPI0025CD0CDD|nr:acetoin utilization protein AcuC [uncultured Corynebacterium sp.]
MTAPRPLLVDAEEMRRYSLGPEHPMGPDRVHMACEVAEHFGLLDEFDVICPTPLSTSELLRVHSPEYVAATRAEVPAARFGLGTEDNPISHGLSTVASRIAAGTVEACRAVWEGRAPRAVNLAGGLHHAFADSMAGFCMYNDAALGIQWLLDNGAQRVAYLDLDAHHGDGVEKIFWDDPRVLTISVHESGLYLFPGTGFAHEIGGRGAEGTAVNLALPRAADDAEWLQAVHALVPALLAKFRPEFLVSQHGADPHRADPLADLELSLDAMAHAYRSVAVWADTYAAGRWVALGGGGYHLDSVARAWTQVLAAAAGVELDRTARMPDGWHGSATLGDEGACTSLAEFDPKRLRTEQPPASLVQTSRAVFPYWGLPAYG